VLRLACLGLVAAAAACGPEPSAADGQVLYAQACARCHAPDGTGDPLQKQRLGVPDMTSAEWQRRTSDGDMKRTIREGSKSRRMPGFGDFFKEPQLDALVKHVRTLGR
jgi:mono/diheme cytochrome c family protein